MTYNFNVLHFLAKVQLFLELTVKSKKEIINNKKAAFYCPFPSGCLSKACQKAFGNSDGNRCSGK
jgi:hypothetical protein